MAKTCRLKEPTRKLVTLNSDVYLRHAMHPTPLHGLSKKESLGIITIQVDLQYTMRTLETDETFLAIVFHLNDFPAGEQRLGKCNAAVFANAISLEINAGNGLIYLQCL